MRSIYIKKYITNARSITAARLPYIYEYPEKYVKYNENAYDAKSQPADAADAPQSCSLNEVFLCGKNVNNAAKPNARTAKKITNLKSSNTDIT